MLLMHSPVVSNVFDLRLLPATSLFFPYINIVLELQFLAESLDVVEDSEWIVTLGNTFAEQYGLYVDDHEHSALLHRYSKMIGLNYFLLVGRAKFQFPLTIFILTFFLFL